MKSTRKTKLDNVASELQASTGLHGAITKETPAKPKRGFKRPPHPELEEIIRLVNSLPANPPALPLTADGVNGLPRELNIHLSSLYDAEMEGGQSASEAWRSLEFEYLKIREAQNALEQLMREAHEISDEETFYFHSPIDAGAYLSIEDGIVTVEMSSFARTIQGAEIDYLRYCETCGKIFYAGRKNQQCCTPKCAKAQRQKRWRQNYKAGYYQS